MNKSEREPLQNRWNGETSKLGMKYLLGKGKAPFPCLGSGREDLRGLVITEMITRADIRDVDLSGAAVEWAGQIGPYTKVRGGVFRYAVIDSNIGDYFSECDFTSTGMSGATIRGEFTDCDFSHTNLSSAGGTEVKFVRCRFTKTNFRKAHLIHCYFEGCQFDECKFGVGSLAGSRLVRSPIDPGMLSDTLMEHVEWS